MDSRDKKSTRFEYFTKKKKVLVVLLIILALVLFGTSYAIWQLTFTQSGTNTITSGCVINL